VRDPSPDAGGPFATLVAVAFDTVGRPLLLLSALAEHTKNLDGCSGASLLVADGASGGDPLAAGRMTLVGPCLRVAEEEQEHSRAAFLSAHPEATAYASFGDFSLWRLEVAGVWWVGGFGRMEWLSRDAYAAACSG
jgi:putative heme iron utilization protein